jgi:uncharacterized Zn finger protein
MSWSSRWRDLFDDREPQVARRIAQGRAWTRSGRVSQVRALPGELSGRVQGTRATPYLVEVTAPTLPDDAWEQVVSRLASEVRHGARLLAGHAPDGLDAELDAAGIGLFPAPDALDLTCACGDRVVPCAHGAALWEFVADALDDDPFLLFRFRGRGREQLLGELSTARRRGSSAERRAAPLSLAEVEVHGWGRARAPLDEVPLPDVEPPATPAAPLRVLGDPPGWAGGVTAWDLFRPIVERAAAFEPAEE